MASDNRCTGNEVIELEAMSKEDSSWHPCQVSLCPSGTGLIVDYGSNLSDDIILDKEEALKRLRIRSVPLQGDDCSHIQQGEHVLATQKSQSKSLFFDAEVEKAVRVRHSKRVYCRCTFMIKWLYKDLKGGTLTVPSSSIMKLAKQSINVHPTISAFLSTLKTLSCSSTSPSATVLEDMYCELELHDLLEKQIEEISNSADVSKKKISEDILLRVEVDTKPQIQCRTIAASKVRKSNIQGTSDVNHLKRTTRSRNKKQIQMEVKDPPPPAPSIEEGVPESRSPLNPLAARAALASLMSQLPQNLEYSIHHEKGNGFTFSSQIAPHKYVTLESPNGTKSYSSCIVNNLSMMDKLSSEIEAVSIPIVPKPENIVKSLFSTRIASGKPKLMDSSFGILTKERENENTTSEIAESSAYSTSSVAEKNINQPTKATRLTRSAIQKGAALPHDDVEGKISVEEPKSRSVTKRLTRSAVHKEKETEAIDAKNVVEESMSAKYAKSYSSDQSSGLQESFILKEKKKVASSLDAEIILHPNEERKSLVKKMESSKKHEIEKKMCAEEKNNLTHMGRSTCSVVHKETGYISSEANQRLEESKLGEHMELKFSEGNVTLQVSKVLQTENSCFSSLDFEINSLPTEEKNKKRNIGCAVKTIQKNTGKVAGNGESSQDLKRKSTATKKQELRFSPRLRLLSQTLSQNES